MKILLLLTFLFFSTLNAQKVLYLSVIDTPKRVLKGEVFSVTIKTISTIKKFKDIKYKFSNYSGLKIINSTPTRKINKKSYLETFYFLATRNKAKLPDITAYLQSDIQYEKTTIKGSKLNIITLNPKKNFSNIIANSFKLLEYKTTSFDTKHNIIIFTAKAENSNLSSIKFNNVFKQGIESISKSYLNPKLTYYLIINKELENFSFSYFNILKNKFINITIPIIVDDDSVTTQTDLKPKDQSKIKLKINIAIGIIFIILVFAIWRKKKAYFIFALIPLIYVIYIAAQSKEICIKKGSNIYLLPMSNGTIFETTSSKYILTKEGSIKNFTKVKLKNEKIGWVKNEDICSF